MKVAFWNGISASDSLACYVAAIGMMLAMECNCNVILSSNYISNRMMQDCFSSKMLEEGIAHTPYCFLCGSQEYHDLLLQMKRKRTNNILEMPIKKMTIVYPPDVFAQSMFYYKCPEQSFYMLDVAKCSIAESRNVLDEADLVVVFLSQDESDIHYFFERFSSLLPKALFVIADYQQDAGYSWRKLKEEYGIDSENIGIIPESREFVKASEEGNLSQFILNSMRAEAKERDRKFVSNLKKIAKKVRARGVSPKKKEPKNE